MEEEDIIKNIMNQEIGKHNFTPERKEIIKKYSENLSENDLLSENEILPENKNLTNNYLRRHGIYYL